MDSFTHSKEELTDIMNQGVSGFIDAMVAEGVITREIAEAMAEYMIVIERPSTFSHRIWRKLLTAFGVKESDFEKEKQILRIMVAKFSANIIRPAENSSEDTNNSESQPSQTRRINIRREDTNACCTKT